MSNPSFSETLQQYFGLEPTLDQSILFSELEIFTRSNEGQHLFLLRGYAGTGKTSSVAAYVKALQHYGVDTVLLAPTGRAAKVFSLKSSKDAYTIHKHIYRRKSKVDLSAGMSLQPNLFKNTVFLVDEASMIGDYTMQKDGSVSQRNLLEDLFEHVYMGQNCRLILIGDDGQLPPVGSDYSPALSAEYLRNHYPKLIIQECKLSQVLRQSNSSEILANATMLRNLKNDVYPKFEVSGNGDLKRINGYDMLDFLEQSYDQFGTDNTIIITRSNKQANKYNQQIRGRIFWYEEALCPGDALMVVKNNYFWMGDDSKMGFIANGEQIKLVRILKREEMYGFEFVHVLVKFVDYEDLGEVELILHTETLVAEGPSLSRERMKELFYAIEADYLDIGNKKKRYEKILENPYFNALQVKYAYAVTCHKSQGGQWNNVFIDQGYLTEEMLGLDYFRWMYTALTRASKQAYLVNFSDEFFKDQSI